MSIGQSLLEIRDKRIFRPPVMDAIIEQFVPDPDTFRITSAFLPMKNVEMDEMVGLFKGGAYGTTSPASLSADVPTVNGRNYEYRDYATTGYWRERMVWDEKVLTRVPSPTQPDRLWGEGLMADSLEFLDGRLNNLIERLSADVVKSRGFSMSRNGVIYTYTAPVSTRYYVTLSAAPTYAFFEDTPWIAPAATAQWNDLVNSDPLRDIKYAVQRARDLGMDVGEVWMRKELANLIEENQNTDIAGLKEIITRNQAFAQSFVSTEQLVLAVPTLKGVKVVIDDRRYEEETTLTAAVSAGGNTLAVADTNGFEVGDTVILRDATQNTPVEEEGVVLSVSASASTITLAAVLTNGFPNQSVVRAVKFFMPADQIWLRVTGQGFRRSPKANWVSTPALTGGSVVPRPGRYQWSYVHDRIPVYAEIGMGIHGGPLVWDGGNWFVVEVI